MDDSTPNETEPTAQPGDIIRAKWAMDGAPTLDVAAQRLEELAAYLRGLHEQGWTLAEPVRDDYGFLVSPDGDTGHHEDDEFDEDDVDPAGGVEAPAGP